MSHNQQKLVITKEEMERCRRSPVYLYNNYIRKGDEKVLSEEEYKHMQDLARSSFRLRGRRGNTIGFELIDDTE